MTDADVPAGYTLVRRDVGAGKTSRVSLVRRDADGALLAWKSPVDDGAAAREAMQWQTARSLDWVRLGVAPAPTTWASDGRTLLQPWIEGETLAHAMTTSRCLVDAAAPRHSALVRFVEKLVRARAFVSGLNAANLVFDGAEWTIVDSGRVSDLPSASEAWDRQRADLRRKWTRGALSRHAADVDAFLAAADAALGLPPLPFSVRRAWRRLRGR